MQPGPTGMGEGLDKQRRRLLAGTVQAAGLAVLGGLGLGVLVEQAAALPAWALRPPGALAERDFLAACIRCGLCVQACPYPTLDLAAGGSGVPVGTPYFIARRAPCEMCEDLPCVRACPSGALNPALEQVDQARMGQAMIVDKQACIAWQGLRCEVCFNVCPLRGQAIVMRLEHNARSGRHARFIPEVKPDACTGCGKCEQACVLDEAAIRVLPLSLVRAQAGEHYRLGWVEKERAGGSLVSPDQPRQFHLPEGVQYDYGTGRVQPRQDADAVLQRLNQARELEDGP